MRRRASGSGCMRWKNRWGGRCTDRQAARRKPCAAVPFTPCADQRPRESSEGCAVRATHAKPGGIVPTRKRFDRSHPPPWERSPGRSSARFGPVQRHGMLADTFPVGRIGDAAARTMDRCRWGRIRSVMPVTWGFLANDRACRPAAGLSGMVSMVTLERHDGVPTRERGNDQDQSINKGVLC